MYAVDLIVCSSLEALCANSYLASSISFRVPIVPWSHEYTMGASSAAPAQHSRPDRQNQAASTKIHTKKRIVEAPVIKQLQDSDPRVLIADAHSFCKAVIVGQLGSSEGLLLCSRTASSTTIGNTGIVIEGERKFVRSTRHGLVLPYLQFDTDLLRYRSTLLEQVKAACLLETLLLSLSGAVVRRGLDSQISYLVAASRSRSMGKSTAGRTLLPRQPCYGVA
jgi:hypothetical protein